MPRPVGDAVRLARQACVGLLEIVRQEAVEVLNAMLKEYGVVVERVRTKDYRFNPEYIRAIESKVKADAEVERLRSEKEEKVREFEIRVAEKQAEVNERIASIDAQFEQTKMMADAYYEKQKLLAEAIKAELLLILTDVDKVYINYGTPKQKALNKVSPTLSPKLTILNYSSVSCCFVRSVTSLSDN